MWVADDIPSRLLIRSIGSRGEADENLSLVTDARQIEETDVGKIYSSARASDYDDARARWVTMVTLWLVVQGCLNALLFASENEMA